MRLKRIGHVNLSVHDVAAADAFYGEILGLERMERPADMPRTGAWFRLGGLELHLSTEVDADNARSKRHVAFEVEDLDAWRREFMTRGISVDDGRPAPDVRRFFVRDPSGNRLEFYELV